MTEDLHPPLTGDIILFFTLLFINLVMTHISDTTECRRLARNVVTADFNDTQIESFQDKEYSLITTLTDKDDWDSLDREFGALQLIETKLVAADIIQHYGDSMESTNMAIAMRDGAMMMLSGPNGIIENMDTETADSEFAVERTEFKGWGLNSSVSPPNRLGSTSTDTESF